MPDGVDGGIHGVGGGGSGGNGTGGMGALSGLPSDSPILLGADVTSPERILYVQPLYPEIARKIRAEGVVILEIVVGRSGDVVEVKILRSHPLFDTAAVEAVKRWKYRPAMLGAQPVRVYMTIRVEFTLK
jgi:protein TonB